MGRGRTLLCFCSDNVESRRQLMPTPTIACVCEQQGWESNAYECKWLLLHLVITVASVEREGVGNGSVQHFFLHLYWFLNGGSKSMKTFRPYFFRGIKNSKKRKE